LKKDENLYCIFRGEKHIFNQSYAASTSQFTVQSEVTKRQGIWRMVEVNFSIHLSYWDYSLYLICRQTLSKKIAKCLLHLIQRTFPKFRQKMYVRVASSVTAMHEHYNHAITSPSHFILPTLLTSHSHSTPSSPFTTYLLYTETTFSPFSLPWILST
jgi:hypothetical protein